MSSALGRGRATGSGFADRPRAPGGSRAPQENRERIESASQRARVDHFCASTRAREAEPSRRRPIFFLRIRLAAQRELFGGGAERSELRWWPSPPAACTGKLMGLGRVLAPRSSAVAAFIRRPVRRRAPRWISFWPWPWPMAELRGQDRRRPLAPGGSRAPKIAECIEIASERARVDHFCALRARARRSRGRRRPIFFFANPAGGAAGVFGGGAERSELRGRRRRPAACNGKLMGLRPCARSEIPARCALYPLAVRRRAPRRLMAARPRPDFLLAVSRGSGSPPAARPRRVSRSENRERIEWHPKGPALITFVNYARARGGCRGRRRPIFFLRIRLAAQRSVRRRRRAQRATGSPSPTGGLHRQADGSRPCARSEISAVGALYPLAVGAERRAGLSNNREQGDC